MAKAKPAKKTTQSKRAPAKEATPAELRHEVWSLVFLVLAVILLLSLVTYHPADPIVGDGGQAGNWIGRFGALIANTVLQGFGYSAYFAVAALGSIGVAFAMRRTVAIKLKEGAGMVLIVVFCSVLFDLGLQAHGKPFMPGGVVGSLIGRLLEPRLGSIGLTILTTLGLVIAIVMATNLPPIQTTSAVSRLILKATAWIAAKLGIAMRDAGSAAANAGQSAWQQHMENKKRKAEESVKKAEEEAAALENEKESEREKQASSQPKIANANAEQLSENKPEDSRVEGSKPGLLDRGEREVVIEVHKPVIRKATDDNEQETTEDIPDTAYEEDEIKQPASKKSSKQKGGEEPQIIDQRPKRASAEEISGEALEAEEPQTEYQLPPLSMLDYIEDGVVEINRDQLYERARLLEQTLLDYKIEGKVKEIHPGPVITMYEFAPARGTKLSKISNLEDDLAMALAALKVRIVAPIPGKSVVGIEVPSSQRETVYFKEIVGHKSFANAKGKLTVALGKDIFGYPVLANLQRMPHLLIAGATGAGKSVGVNSMILSILLRNSPDEVKFILIDPKRLEFNFYEGIPHLLLPVITDPQQAALALGWVVHEMDNRYMEMSEWGVKNIDSYNKLARRLEEASAKRGGDLETVIEDFSNSEGGDLRAIARKLKTSKPPKRMPMIVLVIDELADLMMVAGKEVELSIARLAQLARASGIHLIVATQRPSTDVLTGLIKNNFPARISFRVSQKVDSRVILDRNGAESLLGMGDMLYLSGGADLKRIHGAYVSEEETARVVSFIKQQRKPTYQSNILQQIEQKAEETRSESEEYDSEYDRAVAIVCDSGKASISMLQRKLRIGYNRAARIVEKMEEEGIVGPSDGVRGRPVYGRPIPRD